jgi:hypothetical protein
MEEAILHFDLSYCTRGIRIILDFGREKSWEVETSKK